MRKKTKETFFRICLLILMQAVFTCVIILSFSAFKRVLPSYTTSWEKSESETAHHLIKCLTADEKMYLALSNAEPRQKKYRKKFQMGGDSHIDFIAQETFIFKLVTQFAELAITYHTPDLTSALTLFIYRLATF